MLKCMFFQVFKSLGPLKRDVAANDKTSHRLPAVPHHWGIDQTINI